MDAKTDKQGLLLLGLVGGLLLAAKKVGQGYKYGGFNEEDDSLLPVSAQISSQVALLAQRQGQGDVWLGEEVVMGGFNPEYIIVFVFFFIFFESKKTFSFKTLD